MCPYTVYLCTKFQGNQIMSFHLMVTLTPEWKEEKNEKTKPIFEKSISQKCPAQFSYNLECGVLIVEGVSTAKVVRFRWRSLYMIIALFSSCQYTHGVACQLLGLHDTLQCVLIKYTVASMWCQVHSRRWRLKDPREWKQLVSKISANT